jgi:hypothetical protein
MFIFFLCANSAVQFPLYLQQSLAGCRGGGGRDHCFKSLHQAAVKLANTHILQFSGTLSTHSPSISSLNSPTHFDFKSASPDESKFNPTPAAKHHHTRGSTI